MEVEKIGTEMLRLNGPRDWLRFLFNIPHPETAHFGKLQEEFGRSKNIIRTGYVVDGELNALYNLASVYVQPSYYEGFGMPVLEAMTCGTPVVIAKTNALTEIAGGAALVADPNDPKEMADKITEILKNPTSLKLRGAGEKTKKQLVNSGLKRAKEFSWGKTAKDTLKVYKSLL
jgi:glycosyltransferase involved in cell wall biosynthesis